jgi:hypothetical protein
MGQTPNYHIPYPECAPPLLKDASDIADMRDLAVAADTALAGVYDLAEELVFSPDAVRLLTAASVGPVTGQNVTPLYNTVSFVNGSGMNDITNGVVRLVEPGRYWVGAYASLTAATISQPRIRFTFNGTPVTLFQTPGAIAVAANTATCEAQAVLSSTTPNTALSTTIRHSSLASLSYTYTSRIWAIQLEKY